VDQTSREFTKIPWLTGEGRQAEGAVLGGHR
jgi:hypothetical protein